MKGKYFVVDASNKLHTQYLINDTCIMEEKEPKTEATAKGIIGRGRGPIPPVSDSAMGTKGETYGIQPPGGRGGCYGCLYSNPHPMKLRDVFLLQIKGSQERMVRLFILQ